MPRRFPPSHWVSPALIEKIHEDLQAYRRRKGLPPWEFDMSTFEPAFEFMIPHEGGYVSDPADPGGETKYGISAASYPNENIKDLTVEDAKAIYRRDFWLPGYENLASQDIANKVFDMAVNLGKHAAHRILQKAINCCGGSLTVDGVLGSNTITAANGQDPQALLSKIRESSAEHYRAIAEANPEEAKFLNGWLKRANA